MSGEPGQAQRLARNGLSNRPQGMVGRAVSPTKVNPTERLREEANPIHSAAAARQRSRQETAVCVSTPHHCRHLSCSCSYGVQPPLQALYRGAGGGPRHCRGSVSPAAVSCRARSPTVWIPIKWSFSCALGPTPGMTSIGRWARKLRLGARPDEQQAVWLLNGCCDLSDRLCSRATDARGATHL